MSRFSDSKSSCPSDWNLPRFRRCGFAVLAVGAALLLATARAEALDITPLLPPSVETDAPAPPLPEPVPPDEKKQEKNPDQVLLKQVVGLRFEFFFPPKEGDKGEPSEKGKAGREKPGRGKAGRTGPVAPDADAAPPPEKFTGLVNRVPELDAPLADAQSPLAKAAADILAKPLTWRRLDAVTAAAAEVLRSGGWSLARVFAPEQELSAGTLRLVVMPVPFEGVDVEGTRWTKPERLRRPFRREIGSPVNLPNLERPISIISQHPFRKVAPALTPGKIPGTSRLVLKATEMRPWRVFGGYEMTNSRNMGRGRYFTGFSAVAPWRTEDIVTAQYSTDSSLSHLTSASISYQSSLPWGHYLNFTGLWADSVASPEEHFRQHSRDYLAGLAYTIPLPAFARFTQELTFGIDWRRSVLEKRFDGELYHDYGFDMTPLSLSYRLRRPDRFGTTSLWAETAFSPGSWVGWRSDGESYNRARYATGSRWLVFRWDFRRDWVLPFGFSANNRFWGQYTNVRLPDPARIYLGGGRSVRGYRDSELAGDSGAAVSMELLSPALPLPQLVDAEGKARPHPLTARLAGFWDWGQVRNRTPLDVGEFNAKTLSGAGLGIRMNFADRVSLHADYAWRLHDTGNPEDDKRGYWHGMLQCSF